MARRKNTKRIDPRYFLHETVDRGEELEERMPGVPPEIQRQRDLKGLGLGGEKAQKSEIERMAQRLAQQEADAARPQAADDVYGHALERWRANLQDPDLRAKLRKRGLDEVEEAEEE